MPRTLQEFFSDEAGEYLDKLEQTLQASETPNADELRRVARALRGSARMADQESIARAAGAVLGLADDLASGRRHWGPEQREVLTSALVEIREMVDSAASPPPDLAERAEELAKRLGETAPATLPARDDERFKRYLGTELRALASEIGDALSVLERDPRNREPLKSLLRRIRPLRGVEGIDDIAGVGPSVAAVEEVILKIADTSATVGPGHFVLFRRAQQALDDVATELMRGDDLDTLRGGTEIEDLKDRVLQTSAQREVTWVSEFFYDDPGPHIEACPMAEQGAGSWEAFFALEATGSLDTVDRLRLEMESGGEKARRASEQLAYTLRQLRERAVTFGHAELGKAARRSAAAVRAIVDGPRDQIRSFGRDFAVTVAAFRSYLSASDDDERFDAVARAERSLEQAAQVSEHEVIDIESLTYSAEDALARAKELSGEVEGILRTTDPDIGRAHLLLEEALGLVEHAMDRVGFA